MLPGFLYFFNLLQYKRLFSVNVYNVVLKYLLKEFECVVIVQIQKLGTSYIEI